MDEVSVDELVETGGGLLVRAARDRCQQVEVETSAYDGRGNGAVLGGCGQGDESLLDRLGEGLRHVRRIRRQMALRGGVDQLLDVQRHTARPLVDELDQATRCSLPRQQLVHHPPGLLEVQPREPGLFAQAAAGAASTARTARERSGEARRCAT